MTAQQLRNSILQMAVQGKLVSQDPNDEPASKLLERIRKEKESLIKAGKIKREKDPSIIFRGTDNLPYERRGVEVRCIADEVPFDIPDSWEWVRLGQISSYDSKKQKINAARAEGGTWELDLEDIGKGGRILTRKSVSDCKAIGDKAVFYKGNILYSKLRPYLLKILVAPDDGICTSEIVPFSVFGNILPEYIVLYLKSPYVDFLINSITYGVKMPRVGTDTIIGLFVPLPSLPEQQRIVDKIDELTPRLEQYDQAEQRSAILNFDFPDALKKSILQQAIQGKIVPQDPVDEPASVLLERIRTEKEALIKAGKIKRAKHESIIFRRDNSHYEKLDGIERCIDEEIPFEIPRNWAWARLGTVSETITSGSRDWAKYYSDKGALFLRMGNLSRDSFELRMQTIQHVCLPVKAEGTRTNLNTGDLLFSITGEVGMLGLIPKELGTAYINQHTAMIRFVSLIRNRYIPYVLLTDYAQKIYQGQQHGIKNSFRLDSIGQILVPIPPLSEQERIIAYIESINHKIDTI